MLINIYHVRSNLLNFNPRYNLIIGCIFSPVILMDS
jgi:hypothetical protein